MAGPAGVRPAGENEGPWGDTDRPRGGLPLPGVKRLGHGRLALGAPAVAAAPLLPALAADHGALGMPGVPSLGSHGGRAELGAPIPGSGATD